MPSPETPPTPSNSIEIRPTTYGGRGYFALSPIPANTLIHVSPSPYTLSIIRDFKKECCARCFHCVVGRNLKWRAERGNVAGFWFCGERCKREWEGEEDVAGLLGEAMECLERGFKRQKRAEPPRTPDGKEVGRASTTMDEEMLERVWKDAADAPWPKHGQIPDGEVDQEEARLITYALVRLHNFLSSPGSESSPTWSDFLALQPNALSHFRSQPYLLPSHLHTFHFLRSVLPKSLRGVLTLENFRATTARDPGNSFGIWEQAEGEEGDGESEMLGWAMYPSASYFNHDCDPNTKKVRRGRAMTMVTARDVAEGEELCISYGHLEEDVLERRRRLEDKFFFRCGCGRCKRESGEEQ
ncbi:SET domain-containing protein [Saitoella complicata NRRL Y-17804]|uniref:SET domain-containing protein n=1 Tax=Saitoella complicata (strain BCRC 22490 / CBS 7301 / JCM 7358 / NBRC 10748 / NRRL Y-17804) TaxID=698492 RepID=UPI000866D17B|nr:SET domain-containing protein [Saitoella complicata NRRL Y-17804]ODQ50607.1 SET domain-containing protein [Saitoella complicata NRRL Y-17804]